MTALGQVSSGMRLAVVDAGCELGPQAGTSCGRSTWPGLAPSVAAE